MAAPTLEKAPLVGKGFCPDVYAWGVGRVRYLQLHAGTRRQVEAWQAPLAVAARSFPRPAGVDRKNGCSRLAPGGGRCQ